MRKRQLLFVTYHDEDLDVGLAYTIELAKAMFEDIVLLLVQKKDTFTKKFENLMSGVAFAEANEQETAREMAAGSSRTNSIDYSGKITELVLKCSQAGVHLDVRESDEGVVAGIHNYLRQNGGIDKVVLSPSVTESEILTTRDLNRLLRTASRPIVTMTRQSVQALKEARLRTAAKNLNLEKEYA